MLVEALLLGLVAVVGILESRALGITMIDRPLVMCTLAGLILGDMKQGILIGATLEAVFLGNISIGAATPPDIVTGSILATAFAILSNKGAEAALALAVPISVLSQTLGILVRTIIAQFGHKALKYAQAGNVKGVERMHVLPLILYGLSLFIPVFLGYMFGANIVNSILEAIPDVIMNGLKIASKILPAFGFALLINMMISKKLAVFFFLGFLIAGYLQIDIIGIALFGVILAVIISQFMSNNNGDGGLKEINDNGIEVL